MENNNPYNLPDGWIWITVGEISDRIHYGYTAKANKSKVGPKLLRITDIQNNNVDWNSVPYCEISQEEKKKYILSNGDLVFARTGATVGKSFLISEYFPESVFASYLIRIILKKNINRKFIFYFFQSNQYWSQIHSKKIGSGQSNVNAKKLADIILPLPPREMQDLLVEKIEELFTKLDYGVNILRTIKAQLNQIHQSVLKYAFEGNLTKEWREVNKSMLEPASMLLEKIKDQMKKNSHKKLNGKEVIEKSKLAQLPEFWEWAMIIEIGDVISGKTPKGINEYDSFGDIPFYKVDDMNTKGNEKFMYESKISLNINQIEELRLKIQKEGTVIFPKRGGAIKTNKKRILSKASTYDLNIMGVYPIIIPYMYFYYWILSLDLMWYSDGSNVPQINHKDIEPLMIPIPPLKEQEKIINSLDFHFSILDNVEKIIGKRIKSSDILRQSILKKAFEGKLVDYELNNEIIAKNKKNHTKNNKSKQTNLSEYVK